MAVTGMANGYAGAGCGVVGIGKARLKGDVWIFFGLKYGSTVK